MSKKYFQSFSVLGGRFQGSGGRDVTRSKEFRFAFVVGSEDEVTLREAQRVQGILKAAGASASVRALPGEGETIR